MEVFSLVFLFFYDSVYNEVFASVLDINYKNQFRIYTIESF